MPPEAIVVSGLLLAMIAGVIGLFVYFLPSFIAFRRRHPHRVPILLVNIFGGWTFVGWIGALVWSIVTPQGGDFNPVPAFDDTKICPRCAERIKRAAVVCRFCGYEFGPMPPAPPPPG